MIVGAEIKEGAGVMRNAIQIDVEVTDDDGYWKGRMEPLEIGLEECKVTKLGRAINHSEKKRSSAPVSDAQEHVFGLSAVLLG